MLTEDIANKIEYIASNSTKLYKAGYDQAKQENEQLFFHTSKFGDDTSIINWNLPFFPDELIISADSGYPYEGKYTFQLITLRMRAYSKYAGFFSNNITGGVSITRIKPSQLSQIFIYDEKNKIFKIDFSQNSTYSQVKFRKNIKYYITASSYPNYSIHDALIEEIEKLPDEVPNTHSGNLLYNTNAVYSAFSEEDWLDLTGKKTNWTFVLD